jgi:hypothetical protein
VGMRDVFPSRSVSASVSNNPGALISRSLSPTLLHLSSQTLVGQLGCTLNRPLLSLSKLTVLGCAPSLPSAKHKPNLDLLASLIPVVVVHTAHSLCSLPYPQAPLSQAARHFLTLPAHRSAPNTNQYPATFIVTRASHPTGFHALTCLHSLRPPISLPSLLA